MAHSNVKNALEKLKQELVGHFPEVAKEAGVSTPTVSRVLNNKQVHTDELSERVLIAAKKVRDLLRRQKETHDNRIAKILAA